jgi:hypothetical protein
LLFNNYYQILPADYFPHPPSHILATFSQLCMLNFKQNLEDFIPIQICPKMSQNSSSRKWRKSLFGFGLNWPSIGSAKSGIPPPQSPNEGNGKQKRHNSVSFAPMATSAAAVVPPPRSRGYSTQSWRPSAISPASGHHGSVQSLVIRQKSQQKSSMTAAAAAAAAAANNGGGIARRPSTPSLPLAIVQSVTGRLWKGQQVGKFDSDSARIKHTAFPILLLRNFHIFIG